MTQDHWLKQGGDLLPIGLAPVPPHLMVAQEANTLLPLSLLEGDNRVSVLRKHLLRTHIDFL